MQGQMILYNGPNSPFGRKTKITALVQEINLEEKIINVYESDFLDKHNPLRKIPTLLVGKEAITDSDNICLYLDSISKKNMLLKYAGRQPSASPATGLAEQHKKEQEKLIHNALGI